MILQFLLAPIHLQRSVDAAPGRSIRIVTGPIQSSVLFKLFAAK